MLLRLFAQILAILLICILAPIAILLTICSGIVDLCEMIVIRIGNIFDDLWHF